MDLAKQCMEALEKTGQAGRLSSSPPSPGPDHLYFLYHPRSPEQPWTPAWPKIWLCHERQLHPDLGRVYFSFPDPGLKRAGPPGFCPAQSGTKKSLRPIQGGPQSHPLYPQPSPGKDLSSPVSPGLGLSRGRFSHLFKEETGMSPMAYLQKERLETACSMLLYTDYPLSEISAALCFSSESHFIKIFREYTGRTPGRYRKSQS